MPDPRPTPPVTVPVEDLIRRWRYFTEGIKGGDVDAGDALAAALEATAAERDRLAAAVELRMRLLDRAYATLRDVYVEAIEQAKQAPGSALAEVCRLARERLERP